MSTVYVRVSSLTALERLADRIDGGIDVHLLSDDAPLPPATGIAIICDAADVIPATLTALAQSGEITILRLPADHLSDIRRRHGC